MQCEREVIDPSLHELIVNQIDMARKWTDCQDWDLFAQLNCMFQLCSEGAEATRIAAQLCCSVVGMDCLKFRCVINLLPTTTAAPITTTVYNDDNNEDIPFNEAEDDECVGFVGYEYEEQSLVCSVVPRRQYASQFMMPNEVTNTVSVIGRAGNEVKDCLQYLMSFLLPRLDPKDSENLKSAKHLVEKYAKKMEITSNKSSQPNTHQHRNDSLPCFRVQYELMKTLALSVDLCSRVNAFTTTMNGSSIHELRHVFQRIWHACRAMNEQLDVLRSTTTTLHTQENDPLNNEILFLIQQTQKFCCTVIDKTRPKC
jgi:hypothetical protein